MQGQLQICVAVALVLLLLHTIRMIKKRNLEIKYALSWLAVIAAMLIMDIFPVTMTVMAGIVGIEVPSNLLFIMGFCFFILIVLSLSIEISKMSNINKILTQEVAMLKQRVEMLENVDKEIK